ncbi:hypothetical protein P3W66_29660 [Achromobacter denitrificans]|uniref:ABC-three component system protein n=1 Tax=Achromobacter denitrificans TaxID=32002 RepID=UPI001663C905|nr:ABC-three component system protein [Achromobacter denitrificans]MDF3944256.1 hypothetical protein [Achromobacter denitrificans]GFN28338.1 hypothetical protein ADE_40360 [Achromobacter denitrificans]
MFVRTTPKAASSSEALGQLYGYGIQEARFLHHLLHASHGDAIALEYIDDVTGSKRGKAFVEQDKSGLAHNPISDRAVDLWKTFANWIEGRRSGKIPPGAKFILYIVQPYRGKIAEQFSACNTPQAAKAALQAIRTQFWGSKPTYEKRAQLPEKLAKYVNIVLAAKEAAVIDIICSFTLECGTGVPYEDIAAHIANGPIGQENVDNVLKQLVGWVRTTAYKQISKREPAVITHEQFQQEYVAVARKFDRSNTALPPFATRPSEAQIQDELLKQNYVQQLRLIGADDDLVYDAINTYLMATTDRTEWAKRGYVHRSSFIDYEDALRRTWMLNRTSAKAAIPHASPEQVGYVVLAQCLQATIPLQQQSVTSYFTPGSFHKLANNLVIGWHPEFAKLLTAARSTADVG